MYEGGITMSEQRQDIVDRAEKVVRGLKTYTDKKGNKKMSLTTSQLRKIFAAVVAVKNKVELANSRTKISERSLSSDLALEVKFLKTLVLYQVGRENNNSKNDAMRDFVDRSQITKEIDEIGTSYSRFLEFCKYMEALVAFHKYQLVLEKN